MIEIDSLLNEFTIEADRVERSLSGMLTMVAGGRVPPKSDIQTLEQDIDGLQKAFDSIQLLASEVATEFDLPDANAPVSDFVDAIKRSEELRQKELLFEIENRLNRFISVKSLVAAFEEALNPYQRAAQDILSRLNCEAASSPIDFESTTEAHKLFLDALATEDFTSDAGMELMDKLEAYYPSKVQRGLLMKKYYIDDIRDDVEKVFPEHNSISVVEMRNTPVPEDIIPVAQFVDTNLFDEVEIETKDFTVDDGAAPDEFAENTPIEDIADEIEEEIDSDPSEFINSNVKIKARSASASAFKNEILKMSHEVFTILPLFTNLGVLTAYQVHKFGYYMDCFDLDNDTQERIQKVLDALTNRSILASYTPPKNDETIYCLTSFGHESMSKQSIAVDMRKYFAVSFGNNQLIGKDVMPATSLLIPVIHNYYLLCFFAFMKHRLTNELYISARQSISWQGDHYTILVFANDLDYKCIVTVPNDDYAALLEKGNILIYAKDVNTITVPNYNNSNKVFAHDGVSIYLWDEKWIELVEVLQIETADEEAADSEILISNEIQHDEANDVKDFQNDITQIQDSAATCDDELDCNELENSYSSTVDAKSNDTSENQVDTILDSPSDHAAGQTAADKPLSENALTDDGTVLGYCNFLLENDSTPSDNQFVKLIYRLTEISAQDVSRLKEAVLLAKAASFDEQNPQACCIYKQLTLATNLGIDKTHYSGTTLADAFTQEYPISESCKAAAYLYSMLFPSQPYDHTLIATTQSAVDDFDSVFPSYPDLKALFKTASVVLDASPKGFSDAILDALSDRDKSLATTEKLKKEARPLLNEPKIKAHLNGIPEFISICFGKQSDLHLCMKIIAENNTTESEFVSTVFAEYCDNNADSIMISDNAIDSKIDREWKTATRGKRTNNINLEYQARKQVFNEFCLRLELIKTWLKHSDTAAKTIIPTMKKHKSNLMKEIRLAKEALLCAPQRFDAVLLWMLDEIQAKLDNQEGSNFVFEDLLRTGLIPVDDLCRPILVESMHTVKYAEPWRFVLKHIVADKPDFEDAKNRIFNTASPTFDNLHQLEMIGKRLNSDEDTYIITPYQLTEAIETANANTEQFRDDLELSYTYNRIYEVEKESLSALVDLYHDFFFENKDFGCWKNFLCCLQQQVDDLSKNRKASLKLRLDACASKLHEGERSSLLDEAKRLLDVDANFAVTEEYCNRFESGERQLTEELTATLHDPDSFSTFLSDEVFLPLYEECVRKTGQRLDRFGPAYILTRYPAGWTNRHKEDSRKLLSEWPYRRGVTSSQQIAAFFSGLGFDVRGAQKVLGKKQEVFHLNIKPIVRNMPDYIHPISAFGTQIKSPLNVVVLYGKNMAQELVDTISSLNIGGVSIVLIDYPLDRSVRRQIAEIFHTKMSGMNPFLLIDQVLALHLALHQDTERLPVMLKCSLPYTYYQPFVRDGGPTADEMFCGRASELATIIDPNGACVVYGGRQLGKTALLERAQSLFAKPEAKTFAIYSSILKLRDEESVVNKILTDIKRTCTINLSKSETLLELCAQIDALFRNGSISSMLLLIDEADDFLASISVDDYLPLQPLVDLKRESKNQFKFVLAGLHNVCRAKNATANNGIFGQLGQPLCVKPLSPTDALQLISRPLRYLGFQVDRYPHLETILTNTNYYPGILQFFGYTLVQTMTRQYGKYYRAVDGNPPYTLKKEQLGAILNSADLNNSIKDKFRWSLELDPRYFMLARCIAMLYHENNGEPTSTQRGFSVEQIKDMVSVLDIHCLENETVMNTTILLDEMVDMGILSKPNENENRYRLRRKSFINIIGADVDALLNDILLNNEEGF